MSKVRVYDSASNVIETHEHKGEFKEFLKVRAASPVVSWPTLT